MDRMGKMKVAFLALAMLATACIMVMDSVDVAADDGAGTTEGGDGSTSTEVKTLDEVDFNGVDCVVSMKDANDSETIGKYLERWVEDLDWMALAGADDPEFVKDLKVAVGKEVTPAVAGTKEKLAGTDGKAIFTLKSGDVSSSEITLTIKATPFDVRTLECKVPSALAKNETAASSWVLNTWLKENQKYILGHEGDKDLNVDKVTGGFKAAVNGTSENKDGTDGLYKFNIISGDEIVVSGMECTIKADKYTTSDLIEGQLSYEGTLPEGFKMDIDDYAVTGDDLKKIMENLGVTEYEIPYMIDAKYEITGASVKDRDDNDKSYMTGTVIRMDGKDYVLGISGEFYALHEIGSDRWMKYDLSTGELVDTIEGVETSAVENVRVCVSGTTYVVAYMTVDKKTATLYSGFKYNGYLYTESGVAAGRVYFEGKDISDLGNADVKKELYFNKGQDPKTLGTTGHILASFAKDGKKVNLFQQFSKDVDMTCQGLPVAVVGKVVYTLSAEGTEGMTFFYNTGSEWKAGKIDNGKASAEVTGSSPFVLVQESEDKFSVSSVEANLSSGSSGGDGGSGFNYLWIAGIVVVVLLVGAVFFFMKKSKP